MKVTEELLQKADQIQNFSDGIIMPDGDYRLIEENGHLQTMMAAFAISGERNLENDTGDDSALFLDDRENRMRAYRLQFHSRNGHDARTERGF